MSIASQRKALLKLQDFASKVKDHNVEPISPEEEEVYAGRLNRSLQSLQTQVEEYEAAFQTPTGTTPPVSIEKPDVDVASRIRQLHTITAAYKAATPSEPLLPSFDSPLPALLALRATLKLIDETKTSIRDCRIQIAEAQTHLNRENADLEDALQMTNALEARTEKLRKEKVEMEQAGPEGTVAQVLQARQQKKLYHAKELKRLVVAFNRFIDEHLAVMIAAEQLGGPVAGDDLGIDETTLKAGFNKQGKVKKTKGGKRKASDGNSEEDDLSGATPGAEKHAAGAGFRRLTEELLNALADDENQDSYININKESAAVRFLVRAKVAQFHTEDARKLRLMDFGAGLDDAP